MSHHPLFTNRLIKEKSPYLLQHAHNPVDWYAWGEEAFTAAKEQDKPIFLSIGYATCHWCHVMEQESFSNPEVAKLLNEAFINIKIDREEKPEVDSLYMEFAQAMMSGSAGWPLNVVLTPDLLPFFATTYLPPDSRHGFLGLKQMILRIDEIWRDPEEKETVILQSGKIVDLFEEHIQAKGEELPAKEQIQEAAELLFKTADPIYGGTRGAPKFPVGYQACFLLRYLRKSTDSRALFYVERTLEMMHRGGIYDHLGGGFSRYSVDERWQIPHFEKMLYDNALLTRGYLEAWEYTKNDNYKVVVEDILGYLLRDMVHEEGGFFSAEDADTQEHEGFFYTWSWEEIHNHLGTDATLFCELFGITPTGNFEGRNVLHLTTSLSDFAAAHHLNVSELHAKVTELKRKLWEIREKRVHPAKDDKIITSWNGLMIYALTHAAIAFNDKKYLEAAVKSATFIRDNLWKGEILLRRWREGDARFEGCLDDYAFLIHGLIALFEADAGSEWLEFAMTLTSTLSSDFKAKGGAFFLTSGRDPHLILRRVEFYDGAEASGNGVHAENLIHLAQLTGNRDYLEEAQDILKGAKDHIDMYPPGACYHLMALQRLLDNEAPTIIVSLNEKEEHKAEIEKLLADRFMPHKAVIWRRESDETIRDLLPQCRDKTPVDGKTALYICYPTRCKEPITDLSEMSQVIAKL